MRITPPTGRGQSLPSNIIKIFGCSDTTVAFELLDSNPTVAARRYCNKVLVHECVSVPQSDPMDLEKIEFLATSDSRYKIFEIFKSTVEVDGVDSSIEQELDGDDNTTAISVTFTANDTCCLPLRLAYRLYGYITDTHERVLLSNGNLLVTPCECPAGVTPCTWTEVIW